MSDLISNLTQTALIIWLDIKTFLLVWFLAILATSLFYRVIQAKGKSDSLFWLVWPFLVATFIVTPFLYFIARW